jgi:ketosteroid isomerase-like protein
MSQENVEVVLKTAEAFNRRGTGAFLQFLDPEVEWHDLADAPDAGVHHGHQGVLEAVDRWLSAFGENYRIEPVEFIDGGNEIVAFARHSVQAAEGEADVHQEVASVWTIRGHLVVRVRFFSKREQALEAVDLSE